MLTRPGGGGAYGVHCGRRYNRGVLPILLIHGGLWEPMDAERFWVRPGIVEGLTERGYPVIAPDRLKYAPSWRAEVEHLERGLPEGKFVVVGGSNGCSVAARLAVEHPHRVERLILAWPATNGDPEVDAATREHLIAQGATDTMVGDLLSGETIRGVRDAQLATLNLSVFGSVPENRMHQRWTVEALLKAGAVELEGCPEPPRPEFAAYRERFIECMTAR
jgi:pimeloyl-ACP methyl ester carboxylesterase